MAVAEEEERGAKTERGHAVAMETANVGRKRKL